MAFICAITSFPSCNDDGEVCDTVDTPHAFDQTDADYDGVVVIQKDFVERCAFFCVDSSLLHFW